MLNRFLRVILGLVILFTLVFTILPSVVLWIFTGRFYILEVGEWCITNEYPND